MATHTNRLIDETSPYLRQHAHNPVDWYPWGAEAFQRAKTENKPILLSVGYSACHWCHVMERESFENEAIAELMNTHFVNIKVDREERPDVDNIYMKAVQLFTGNGGWPMTVFLTPEGKPFYGGTYFPPEDRQNMPGFPRVLRAFAAAYRDKSDELHSTVAKVMDGLQQLETVHPADAPLDTTCLSDAATQLATQYDATNGGLGHAPKFPSAAALDLFLRTYHQSGQQQYLDMTLHTLRSMAHGGIYDQLGGGFHRYTVDQQWLIPHFEKMLYDNAALVPLYLSAYQLTTDTFFATIARETLDYVAREMRDTHGGFYSTQDADSEGVEGKFFVWQPAEVQQLLGEEHAEIVCRYWDITDTGNFEGHNILHVILDMEQLAARFRRDVASTRQIIATARDTLFRAREQRIKPGRDEKILTAWNALMISAFAKGAAVLQDERYRQIAVDAATFIDTQLQQKNRLLSTYKDGTARLNGYLDDYAFFIAALLDLYEVTHEWHYITRAEALMQSLLTHFWDDSSAGFFFTSDDHETLIVRSKPAVDSSIPSGNAVATQALLRLYHYTEHEEYRQRAEAVLQLYAGHMRTHPFGFATMLCAADYSIRSPREIAVVGDVRTEETRTLVQQLQQQYIPNRTLSVVAPDNTEQLPAALRDKTQRDSRPTVYVCHQRTCSAPATTWEEIHPLL